MIRTVVYSFRTHKEEVKEPEVPKCYPNIILLEGIYIFGSKSLPMIKRLFILFIVIASIAKEAYGQCSISITGNTIICSGQIDTLTANGATSYTWSGGGGNTATNVVNPFATTIYVVTGSTGTCTATNTITITVNNCTTPIVNFSKSVDTVCIGHCIIFKDSTQYTSTKPLYYTWVFPGATSPYGIIYPPAGASVYSDTLIYSMTSNTPLNPIKVCYDIYNPTDPYYHVIEIVKNGIGQSASKIDSFLILTNCAAGISQYSNLNTNISIYPNPASTSLTLTLSKGEGMFSVEIYNAVGACVHRQIATSPNSQIDVSDLSEGIYNVSISTKEGTLNKRVVIVK